MDFVIRKDIYGNWWHKLGDLASEPLVSDFEATIDNGLNTFIIQCFNGSNIPSQSVSIANVKVIDQSISETPIPFSGSVGLKNLLTAKGYTPFLSPNGVTQDLAMVLAVDNKTNDIPIVSNNGSGYLNIGDDAVNLGYGTPNVKSIQIEADAFTLNSDVPIIINGGGLRIDSINYGLVIPRMTTSQKNAIATPLTSMLVYDTTLSKFYQYNGSAWVVFGESGGAVDSVNGQTGVVVLDAGDVGAEPTKGSDDNYVTDAQLVVIGNTSGTNSGDNATNTKYEVAATTGAVISFATPQVYNSIASPSSSNLTDNLSGAQIGVVQKIYHNAGTAPTVPAGWVKRGTGNYVTSTLNIIYAEWSAGTTVEYWITQ